MAEKKKTTPKKKADTAKKPVAKKAAAASTALKKDTKKAATPSAALKADAKKGMTFEEIKAALAGTLIGQVIDVMESGDFVEIDQQLDEEFEIVGIATVLEKALTTVRCECVDEIKALQGNEEAAMERFFALLEGDPKKLDEMRAIGKKVSELLDAIKLAEMLITNSVQPRLTKEGIASIFSGYLIGLKKAPASGGIFDELEKMLEASSGPQGIFQGAFRRGRR